VLDAPYAYDNWLMLCRRKAKPALQRVTASLALAARHSHPRSAALPLQRQGALNALKYEGQLESIRFCHKDSKKAMKSGFWLISSAAAKYLFRPFALLDRRLDKPVFFQFFFSERGLKEA
jgi:hypothetical protein